METLQTPSPDDLALQIADRGVGVWEIGEQALRGQGIGPADGLGGHVFDVVLWLHPHLLPGDQHLQVPRAAQHLSLIRGRTHAATYSQLCKCEALLQYARPLAKVQGCMESHGEFDQDFS